MPRGCAAPGSRAAFWPSWLRAIIFSTAISPGCSTPEITCRALHHRSAWRARTFTFPLLTHDAALGLIASIEIGAVDIGLHQGRTHVQPGDFLGRIPAAARAMKCRAIQKLREKLAEGVPTYGLWITLEAPSLTEMAVALGLDWVVISAEHGHLDWKEIIEHLRAAVRSDTVALVEIAERSTVLAKRALDLGADGVVIPWVETAEQLAEAIRDCRYLPEGRRGIGGERATVWGQCLQEHTAEANAHVLVVPKIESVATMAQVPAMCEVDGTEIFLFGPADFSATAGYRGQWEGPRVAEQILAAKDILRSHGKHCGLIATSLENLKLRRAQGFGFIAVGTDVGLELRGIREALAALDRDRKPAPSLDPRDGTPTQARSAATPPPDAAPR